MAALLKGTAFITGAASGIGQYTAFSFAKHGIKALALTDINYAALKRTVDGVKALNADIEVRAIEMDVSKEASIDKGFAEAASAFGRIDVTVNNAGIAGPNKKSHEVEVGDWEKLIGVNLNGVWMCQRAAVRQMLKQESRGEREGRGVIVNTASMYGIVGTGQVTATAYAAAKHGVMGLTKSDAAIYAADGIRINAICPGYVATPLLEGSMHLMQGEMAKIPMGRFAKMEEIADTITFLASPLSSYMCGAGLIADGGYTSN